MGLNYVFPNQKLVTVHKAPTDTEHIYLRINKEALFSAMKELKPNELKVFLYLASNQPEYFLGLSPKAMSQEIGGNEKGLQSGIRGLIDKGYLVAEAGNRYGFYEFPKEKLQETEINGESDEQNRGVIGRKSSDTGQKNGGEIKHNKTEKTINNTDWLRTKKLKNEMETASDGLKRLFEKIDVDLLPHTLRELEKLAGEPLDERVVRELIESNQKAFYLKKNETQSYRYTILKRLIESGYVKTKNKVDFMREQAEVERQEAIKKAEIRRQEQRAMENAALMAEEASRKRQVQESKFDLLAALEDW